MLASCQLGKGQIDALEQRANLQEELERVLFVLHILVVAHFQNEFALDPFKIIAYDVVQNYLV